MTLKEFIQFTYGLVMGTSTPYLKPSKRFLFPTMRHDFDKELSLYLGGSGICAVLGQGSDALIINLNQGSAAKSWHQELDARGITRQVPVVLNSLAPEFAGGWPVFVAHQKLLTGPATSAELSRQLGPLAKAVEVVNQERVFEVAGERVWLIPVGPAASESDLAVFFESRSLLMMGALFYNHIHPVLRPGPGLKIDHWLKVSEELLERLQPQTLVPGEGDLGDAASVREFLDYLKALSDPAVEFAYCRSHFDWAEIPSYTSLEENFEILRGHAKTHTTLRS